MSKRSWKVRAFGLPVLPTDLQPTKCRLRPCQGRSCEGGSSLLQRAVAAGLHWASVNSQLMMISMF